MIPVLPIAAGVAAVAALGYALYKRSAPGLAKAMNELAKKYATTSQRGERVFRPDIAGGIVAALPSRFYTWPDSKEPRVVEVVTNKKGGPTPVDLSAENWARLMNVTQSILCTLASAETNSSSPTLLRACPPGLENQYAGDGMMYAVLLYAGTYDKHLGAPGVEPPNIVPDSPLPVDALESVRLELEDYPELLAEFMRLLQEGEDADAIDRFAGELERDTFTAAPAILRRRAADIRKDHPGAGPVPAFKPGVDVPPPFKPGVQDAPPPQGLPGLPDPAVIPPGNAIVVTKTDPLSVRSAPNTSALIVGKLAKGSVVQVTGPIEGGFYPVSQGSVHGYAYGGYLRAAGAAPLPGGGGAPRPDLPPPQDVPVGTAVVTTASDPLSIRSAPSLGANIVGKAPKGATVEITGPLQGDGFMPIAYGSIRGFAYSAYLTPTGGPATSAQAPSGQTMTVVQAPSGLNLRASPTTSGTVVAKMPNGSTVTVLEPERSGWVHVDWNGRQGYASADYLS